MTKLTINENNTIMECYKHSEQLHNHAPNTKAAYTKACFSFQSFMEEQGIVPSVKNIDFSIAQAWKRSLYNLSFADLTIKQKIASLKALNEYLINLGILKANVLKKIDIKVVNTKNHHSRALSLTELYQVYKIAIQLESNGKNVLMSTLIAIYTGVRNEALGKFKVNSLTANRRLEFLHGNSETNTKNKDISLPLPPSLLNKLHDHIELNGLQPEDPLLYGLRGNKLGNKQFNTITKNLCIALGWMTVRDLNQNESSLKDNEIIDGRKVYAKTDKYFTPHGFRYTIATLFSEMGMNNDSIKYLLGHSEFDKGNLKSYIHSDRKYLKEISCGQLLIETVLETAFMLEHSNKIQLDIEYIENDLPRVFDIIKRDVSSIEQFKAYLISFAFSQAQHKHTPSLSQQPVYFNHPGQQLDAVDPIMQMQYGHQYAPQQGMLNFMSHQQSYTGPKTFYNTYDSNIPSFNPHF